MPISLISSLNRISTTSVEREHGHTRHTEIRLPTRVSRAPDSSSALQTQLTQLSAKQKRRAVKAIVRDYKCLQDRGLSNGSADILNSRGAYMGELDGLSTRLAQLRTSGLSTEPPRFSTSRSAKNALAIAGGGISKVAEIGVSGTAFAIGTTAAVAIGVAASPCMLVSPLQHEFNLAAIKDDARVFFLSPGKAIYEFLRSKYYYGGFLDISHMYQALDYARRPRLSTARIAATTSERMADEFAHRTQLISSAQNAALCPGNSIPTVRNKTVNKNWRFPETEENADAFNAFQERLITTAEYNNTLSKPQFIERVNILVQRMHDSQDLRLLCFGIAADSIQSCQDRVALGLNDMEQAFLSEKVLTGELQPQQMLAIGLQTFKMAELDRIALKKINDLRKTNRGIDEIEIRLAYPTELRGRLNLQSVAQTMMYRRSAAVSDSDIKKAAEIVKEKIQSGEAISFLAQWGPWRTSLQFQDPKVWHTHDEAIQINRDAISSIPPGMTDQQWLTALAKQQNDEATETYNLAKELTCRFIADHHIIL